MFFFSILATRRSDTNDYVTTVDTDILKTAEFTMTKTDIDYNQSDSVTGTATIASM